MQSRSTSAVQPASASSVQPAPSAAPLQLQPSAPLDQRHLAAAGAGGDGPEIPLIFRITKVRGEHIPTYDAIRDDDPDRDVLRASAKRLAELAVDQSLKAYIEDGKLALGKVYDLEGDEVIVPHVAYGTATEPIHRWSKKYAAPVPAHANGTRFLQRLPTAGIVVVIGIDGLTDVAQSLLDDFAIHLQDGCEVVVSRGGGSKRPLVVTREELVEGLETHLAGGDMSGVASDVKKWLKGLGKGMARRVGAGKKMQQHGGEIRRSAFRRPRAQREEGEEDQDEDEDEDEEDEDDALSSSPVQGALPLLPSARAACPLYAACALVLTPLDRFLAPSRSQRQGSRLLAGGHTSSAARCVSSSPRALSRRARR